MSANVSFIVERRNWRRIRGSWLALPGWNRLTAYADREAADVNAGELEWELRRRINPFKCGGPVLHYQSSFDAPRLFDWCIDIGLEPPGITSDSRIWADWWAVHHPQMTTIQRATLWEALDRVRFYQVTESERGLDCHLVGMRHEIEDPIGPDEHFTRHLIGCTPYMLTRTQATADALCDELFHDELAREGRYWIQLGQPETWVAREFDPLGEDEEISFDIWYPPERPVERRPLEVHFAMPPRPGQTLYVVLRRHWRLEYTDRATWRWSLPPVKTCGRPIAAFDTLTAADACQARLDLEARETASPFRFGPPHEWSVLNASALWGMLSELGHIDFTSLWNDYKASDQVWCRWWDEVVPALKPEQIERVWNLYDRIKFYEVAEVEYRE